MHFAFDTDKSLSCLHVGCCLSVDDEDEEVSSLMDPDSLDPGSVSGSRSGRRSPRALSPARVTRSPRPTSPARAPSPAKQGRNRIVCCAHVLKHMIELMCAYFYISAGNLGCLRETTHCSVLFEKFLSRCVSK